MAALQFTERERNGHAESWLPPRARSSEESGATGDAGGREAGAVDLHRWSHCDLVHAVHHYSSGSPKLRLGCVVVPAARLLGTGSGVAFAADVAARHGAHLVILASREATRRPLPELLIPPTVPVTVVNVPPGAERILPWGSDEQPIASWHRDSDLGFKRNVGLLIGRMCAFDVVMFVDDDISTTRASQLGRPDGGGGDPFASIDRVLAEFVEFGNVHVAGWHQQDMDDHSVLYHALRLVGRRQDTFISGGTLAARAGGPLPFFPTVYNEDWVFNALVMLESAPREPYGGVRCAGTVYQDAYPQFTIERAKSEELGDLFAEGLYSLLAGGPRAQVATMAAKRAYWEEAIESRLRLIDDTLSELYRMSGGAASGVAVDACAAVQAAREVYADAPFDVADALAEYLGAVTQDRKIWRELLDSLTARSRADALTPMEALSSMGLDDQVTFHPTTSHGRRAS